MQLIIPATAALATLTVLTGAAAPALADTASTSTPTVACAAKPDGKVHAKTAPKFCFDPYNMKQGLFLAGLHYKDDWGKKVVHAKADYAFGPGYHRKNAHIKFVRMTFNGEKVYKIMALGNGNAWFTFAMPF